MLKYICHCYLDSGNVNLFSAKENSENVRCLKKVIELIKDDLEIIQAEWHKEDKDCIILQPDGNQTSFLIESKLFALQFVIEFFKSFLKNKKIDLGLDMFPIFHDITTRIAKMYYDTTNEDYKSNAMDIL